MKWIKVEDKLPDVCINVLGWDAARNQYVICFMDWDGDWINENISSVPIRITNWSYLPPPFLE